MIFDIYSWEIINPLLSYVNSFLLTIFVQISGEGKIVFFIEEKMPLLLHWILNGFKSNFKFPPLSISLFPFSIESKIVLKLK